jgi:ADP-dependent NAD(P)H-hydrate dehydratase / NAD(P)H-hydrate epimerase
MRHAHAVPEVRAAEQALMATLPEGTLMQRAAAGLAAACTSLLDQAYGARVAVLAGSGDNGGDALFAGARLARRGARVTAVAAGSRLHDAGLAALTAAGGLVVAATGNDGGAAAAGDATDRGVAAAARSAIASADLILDGLTGIGGSGGLREPAAALAAITELAREEGSTVVAVDLPSGVDASTGEVHGAAIRADVTVTFGTWKPGLLIDPGSELAGATRLVDIGLGPYLPEPTALALQSRDVAALLPHPSAESDKYRRGVLGLLAGSDRYTGAAALATGAAIRGGAGAVRLVTAPTAVRVVRQRWPEALLTEIGNEAAPQLLESAGRVQAWVAGPGMGTDEAATQRLAAVLATDLPVLVDADGITILAANPGFLPRAAPTLITPHAGELARLLQADRADIEARRLHYATDAAAKLGVTVLLKGSTTIIAGPQEGGPVFVNPTGTSWLATAGSGDVLSGLTGSLLAQGLLAAEAAAVGAYLHGLAARIAADDAPIGAGDLIGALPEATRTVAESV